MHCSLATVVFVANRAIERLLQPVRPQMALQVFVAPVGLDAAGDGADVLSGVFVRAHRGIHGCHGHCGLERHGIRVWLTERLEDDVGEARSRGRDRDCPCPSVSPWGRWAKRGVQSDT